jgi:hypothetical protein
MRRIPLLSPETLHEQSFRIIEESPSYATFLKKPWEWATENLIGGANLLPPGLRP